MKLYLSFITAIIFSSYTCVCINILIEENTYLQFKMTILGMIGKLGSNLGELFEMEQLLFNKNKLCTTIILCLILI